MATRSDRVSVRLEADELNMLRQLATNLGVSTSDALRTMIRDTFSRKKLTINAKPAAKKPPSKAAKKPEKGAKKPAKKAPAKKAGRKTAKKARP